MKRIMQVVTNENTENTLYRTVVSNTQKIGNKYFASVPRELLKVDPDYQRIDTRSAAKIELLARNWDDNKMSPLSVVAHEEEGKFYVVDGYGRLVASSMIETPKKELECQIIFDAPLDDHERKLFEARLFIDQTKELELIKPYHKHKANLLLGDEVCIAMQEVCDKYGVTICTGTGQRGRGMLGSYTDCFRITKAVGKAGLEFVFETIQKLHWHEEKNGYSRTVMNGMLKVYRTNKDHEKLQRFVVSKLRGTTPEKFRANAVSKYPQRYETTAAAMFMEDILEDFTEEA